MSVFALLYAPAVNIILLAHLFSLDSSKHKNCRLGDVLRSQDPAVQVLSALEGLTVVFGMGTRGSPPPLPPNQLA